MMDCGCKVKRWGGMEDHPPRVEVVGDEFVSIDFCPLHTAASETLRQRDLLLEAAKLVHQWVTDGYLPLGWSKSRLMATFGAAIKEVE